MKMQRGEYQTLKQFCKKYENSTVLDTNPKYSSIGELNRWLHSLIRIQRIVTIDSVEVPRTLMQKALDNPGSVSLSEWLRAMKPVQYYIKITDIKRLQDF